ncbi:MAG: hypothetical protein ABRQ25_06605 [Clostridiaceae bacterium]
MKRGIKFLAFICMILISAAFSYRMSKEKIRMSLADGYAYGMVYKGQTEAVAICEDEDNNIYEAAKDRIIKIGTDGIEECIMRDSRMNILSIAYCNERLYFISGNFLYELKIIDKSMKMLMNNIPSVGSDKECRLLVSGERLYIAIGSVSDSGIASKGDTYDVLPADVVLSGVNYGNTGAFVPYGTLTAKKQIIKGGFPGNASVIYYDLKSGNKGLYAWGLKNVTGLDSDSKGLIFACEEGMKASGARPVYGDTDYIYTIEEGVWYGWPDFSGGDPVNSSKFSEKNLEKTKMILEKHPGNNPPAPFFQSSTLSGLRGLAVDKNGDVFPKDSIVFFDKHAKKVFTLSKEGILSSYISVKGNVEINDIKISSEGILLLEKNQGSIYKIYKSNGSSAYFSKKLSIIVLTMLFMFIISIVVRYRITKEVK